MGDVAAQPWRAVDYDGGDVAWPLAGSAAAAGSRLAAAEARLAAAEATLVAERAKAEEFQRAAEEARKNKEWWAAFMSSKRAKEARAS